ncbi:MAG: hypothetical protein HUJ91_06430, partial [Bacteroidales bacterium]|nr:hypothetical protein [Bacteroidales bacterium]
AQMTHYTTGVFKWLHYLVGEQATGLGAGLYPTGWTLEGDAVHNETDFSEAGRGRDPNFLMFFKASFVEGDYRSYDRWRYGSFRNYTPSKYAFGYLVQTSMRLSSGNYQMMGDIYHDFAYKWYDPSIWNKAFRKYTGKTGRKHFRAVTSMMTDYWKWDYTQRGEYTPMTSLSSYDNKYYATYHSPLPMEDGLYVVKAGLAHVSKLVRIDSLGKEKFVRPFAAQNLTSTVVMKNDHTLVWSEIVPDLRWELSSKSIIREYDTQTGKIRNLTRGTRYFNPSFSPDTTMMAVTEYPVEGGSSLVILDAASGNEIMRAAAPENGQIKGSVWVGSKVYADAITEKGWGLYSKNIDDMDASWSQEIAPQSRSIVNLRTIGPNIIFETDLDGVTNIYSYNPATAALHKLTNARYGVFYPYFDATTNRLFVSDYDRFGYHPSAIDASDLKWSEASFEKPYDFLYPRIFSMASRSVVPEPDARQDSTLKQEIASLQAKPFRKTGHLMNIHSWAPVYVNVERIMDMSYDKLYQLAAPGATLISQNLLGTATTTLGYSHHDGRHQGHLNFNYTGLFPVIELSLDVNDREKSFYEFTDEGKLSDPIGAGKPSVDASLLIYAPLNLSRSGYSSALIPKITFNYSNDEYDYGRLGKVSNQSLSYGVRFYKMLPKTRSSLMPRCGWGAEASGVYVPGPRGMGSQVACGYVYGYLPGLSKQQGVKLTVTSQKQFTGALGTYLSSIASLPRGYSREVLDNYCKLTADYAIPISLNDWHPVPILYLMRINCVPFVDVAWNMVGTERQQRMCSYGSSVSFVGHYFRIGAQVEVGVRAGRWYDTRKGEWSNSFRLVTGVSL